MNHSPPSLIRPWILGISGGSGSGKTWLASWLQRQLSPHAVVISQDSYYRSRRGSPPMGLGWNFDQPRAVDLAALARDLLALRAGKTVEVPCYDFSTHRRRPEGTLVQSHQVILVEGLFVLTSPTVRRCLDWSIYVDCPPDLRLLRRLRRDVVERGIATEETLRMYEDRVRPMHALHVEPGKALAHCVWPAEASSVMRRNLLKEIRHQFQSP